MHDSRGRFKKGNPGGPGNPFQNKTAKLRAALIQAVSEEDIQKVMQELVKKAKLGDVVAAREVLDRTLGKAKNEMDVKVDVDLNGISKEELLEGAAEEFRREGWTIEPPTSK